MGNALEPSERALNARNMEHKRNSRLRGDCVVKVRLSKNVSLLKSLYVLPINNMFKIFYPLIKCRSLSKFVFKNHVHISKRTFLSQAYYCQEVWDHRLQDPILQKVNLEELYYEIDQRFQKTRQVSAVDADIFVNAVRDGSYNDEILDVIHKLRLSADAGNALESTTHAVIRTLIQFGNNKDLLDALDDRLNYGMFLDFYTANILMDTYWKSNDFTSGARIASQLMLQEEFEHPLSRNFSLLHCYNFLLRPEGWPEYQKPEEPEEEVKIRVKYLRNPYDDDHFDLRDHNKIVGKTLAMFTKGRNDSLNKSLNILGLILYDKPKAAKESINKCISENIVLYKELVDLIPSENECKKDLENATTESANVQDILKVNVEKVAQESSENDIANQCKLFLKWESDRANALDEQKKRILTAKRLQNIEDLKKALKEKETKLWFFSNEEQIELEIEAKHGSRPKSEKATKVDEEGYVPPEVQSKRNVS
ncbi:hypothetical protein NQ315_016549 [Exocentrus adspersus]|uniref:28S ribosomal protein S27, mitochondrial n=1 Tax=Exocentrus adspersus TaxID=1586481 RepID=A0AAV8VYR1_9CUCU|nr:hypothetical protein NQ315_016549 [Exocentrus adspersus]